MISERAPLEMTYISMSPKVICEGEKRPLGGRVCEGVFEFGTRKKKQFLMRINLRKDVLHMISSK